MTRASKGLKVVALGGGHGAAQTLRAARRYAGEITAIISVADDGGSSGRLRAELGIPAPGDLRRCLGALLPDGALLAETLEHRFGAGQLEGHAFGNLLIAALAATTGDFAQGVEQAARLLGVEGRVLPATTEPVVLRGTGRGGEVSGQARIVQTGGVSTVHLDPPDVLPPPGAVEAILEADQVVLGPGSLYTSLLAVTAVEPIREALGKTSAQRVYVANLKEQPPETAGFDLADHLEALSAHEVTVDVVLAHDGGLRDGKLPDAVRVEHVRLSDDGALSHDPELLARALGRLMLAQAT